jgi:transposase InsO family protein
MISVTALPVPVFHRLEHANSEVVGIHAARSANRFEALEPVRQGVHRCFGAIAPGVARGLKLRHDHGSNYMSGDFQDEIECLSIEASPSFVREPEGNGVAERFIRTLKENLLWDRKAVRRARRVRHALQRNLARRTAWIQDASISQSRASEAATCD